MVWTNGWWGGGAAAGAWPLPSGEQTVKYSGTWGAAGKWSTAWSHQERRICTMEIGRCFRSGFFILGFPGRRFASTPPREESQVVHPCPRTWSSSQASHRPLPPASAPQTTYRTTRSSQIRLCSAGMLSIADVRALSTPLRKGGFVILSATEPLNSPMGQAPEPRRWTGEHQVCALHVPCLALGTQCRALNGRVNG